MFDSLPALAPYMLILGAFTIVGFKLFKAPRLLVKTYAFIYVLAGFLLSVLIFAQARERILLYTIGGFPPPIGITYVVDEFSGFMGLLIASFFLVFYPVFYLFSPVIDEYVLALLLGLEAGLLGVVYTGDMFNMFVMLEVILTSAYGLVAASCTKQSYESVLRYLFVAGVGGLFFFTGVTLAYFSVGTLNIGHAGLIASRVETGYMGRSLTPATSLLMALALAFIGLFIEEALAPFHFWAPGVYGSAPPAVSATLAALSEAVAYYALLRLSYVLFGEIPQLLSYALIVFGALSILVGGLGLLLSEEIGQAFGYTVVMDSGYMAVAAALGAPGVVVVTAYVLAHTIVKPILFLVSGWAREAAGSGELGLVKGVFRNSLPMQVGLFVGALALTGIPPTLMFYAKLGVYTALLSYNDTGLFTGIVLLVALTGSLLALAGFSKIISYTVSQPPARDFKKPPKALEAYVLALSVLVLLVGLLFPLIEGYIFHLATVQTGGREAYLNAVLNSLYR